MGGSFLKDIRVVFFGGVFRFWWGVFGLQLSGSTVIIQLDLTQNESKYIFEYFGPLANQFKPNLTWKGQDKDL